MFNLRQLRSFIFVAQHKSFTKAAKMLYMTQPAISAQIKSLEERLDVQLMERNDKHVVLTEAGFIFLAEAEKMLAAHERIVESIGDLKGLRRGHLKVAASTIPGEYLLPKFIGHFKEKYEKIGVELSINDTEQVVEALRDRIADVGVTGAKIKCDVVRYENLIKDELIIIAANNSAIARMENLKPEDLVLAKFILREPGSGTRKVMLDRLKGIQIDFDDLDVVMELGSTRAVITAVEAGLGISMVSRWAAQQSLQLQTVKEIQVPGWNHSRQLYIAWNANKYMNKVAETFINEIKGYNF